MSLQRRTAATLAVAAVVVSLALPAGAAADHGESFLHDDLATYMDVAHTQWGGPMPSCVENGVTVIPVHAVLYNDPDPEVVARAEQPGCRLWLDRSWLRLPRVEACTTIVHEWGHLLGFGHSGNPFDLMAEFQLRPAAGCRRFAPSARARASRRASSRRCKIRLTRRVARVARRHVARRACVLHRG